MDNINRIEYRRIIKKMNILNVEYVEDIKI